jgi:hypothetical protein
MGLREDSAESCRRVPRPSAKRSPNRSRRSSPVCTRKPRRGATRRSRWRPRRSTVRGHRAHRWKRPYPSRLPSHRRPPGCLQFRKSRFLIHHRCHHFQTDRFHLRVQPRRLRVRRRFRTVHCLPDLPLDRFQTHHRFRRRRCFQMRLRARPRPARGRRRTHQSCTSRSGSRSRIGRSCRFRRDCRRLAPSQWPRSGGGYHIRRTPKST